MIQKGTMNLLKKAALLTLVMTGTLHAESILKDGDTLAICGDSITEQRLYSVMIEDYILMCQPAKVQVTQFGWGGEQATGFLSRMNHDVLPFKPTLATTCYGMNDGLYNKPSDSVRSKYHDAMTEIVKRFQAAGTKVIVGSPGVVDSRTFINARKAVDAKTYNTTLAQLRDEAQTVAKETESVFANVFDPMHSAMDAAEAKYPANDYHVAGRDGIHPAANGHLVMAYAFLKAMGFDGNVGEFTLDLSTGKADASKGHKVLSSDKTNLKIESSVYPFCFQGDRGKVNSTTNLLEFVPFNQDLNRLTLKVAGASAPKYKITWGEESKVYTSAELAKGVNLAAEFLNNPFSQPFADVESKIREQQNFETPTYKGLLRTIGTSRTNLPEAEAQFDAVVEAIRKHDQQLFVAARESLKPVTHTITIEPVTTEK